MADEESERTKPEPQTISDVGIRGDLSVQMGTPRVGVRDYLASQHLWTARREAWLCRKREDQLLTDGTLDRRHRAHAVTTVLSSVAFLEAFINASWQDAADKKPGTHTAFTEGIPDDALATMRELWIGRDGAERMLSLQSKFQVALTCAGRERLDDGAEPLQSAGLLIELRNVLTHFKPQWHWSDGEAKFVRKLKGVLQSRENRQPVGNPWFPNKALGAGCADWACKTSIDFARAWHDRIGLTSDFDYLYLTSLPPVEID